MNQLKQTCIVFATATVLASLPPPLQARNTDWQRQPVDWRMTNGMRIQAVRYPHDRPLPQLALPETRLSSSATRRAISLDGTDKTTLAAQPDTSVLAHVINSPPIDGFVPWIAIVTTDARQAPLEVAGVRELSVTGDYTIASPESDYVIGLFDTGASTNVMGNVAATQLGLFAGGYVTTNTTLISGVSGSVYAWVTDPIGLFVDGLGGIDPDTLLLDLDSPTSAVVGESNVSILVGQDFTPPQPDLATALGTPLAAFFTTVIRNDLIHTVIRDNQTYRAPDIHLYNQNDPRIPSYSHRASLELRPQGLGGLTVQYFPCIEIWGGECPGGADRPEVPSIIADMLFVGNQSLFFFQRVDLRDGANDSRYNDKFMLDTGAQVTVIGSSVGADLRLDPDHPDFEVEILDVTGEITYQPGFYIDTLDIPALGEWLSYTNVPVVLLDVASPEGGYLDGIIGMNLFLRYNLVLQGGGLYGYDPPRLSFRFLTVDADFNNDGDVDQEDFGHLQACLTGQDVPQVLSACADARLDGDADVDYDDFLLFRDCTSGPDVLAGSDCTR